MKSLTLRKLISIALLLAIQESSRAQVADHQDRSGEFAVFSKAQAAALRADDEAPKTLQQWQQLRALVRERLLEAWGGFPEEKSPLKEMRLGSFEREGYRVEKIALRTRPGIWLTASAYVPEKRADGGKVPAVICVHGHSVQGKEQPGEQVRAISLARLGFFVLAVDAFGAGERSPSGKLDEYHGALNSAPLLPVGMPLCGLQVYDNMRAVDYLLTRPEVDGARIGITGASGGGNQSIYAGSWDERIAAVAPFCSVGTYQAHLGLAACICTLIPGGLTFSEEWGVLGSVAPRALLVGSAQHDILNFDEVEVRKTLAMLRPVFELYDRGEKLRHASFDLPHGYPREMREAVYGWFTQQLKGKGDGSPIAEAERVAVENAETLRCFPVGERPDDFLTMAQFAAVQGRELLAKVERPGDAETWEKDAKVRRLALIDDVFGGVGQGGKTDARAVDTDGEVRRTIEFSPEPGLTLRAKQIRDPKASRLAIVLDLAGAEIAERESAELIARLRKAGWSTLTLDLRSTGALLPAHAKNRDIPDFKNSLWAMWIGRPLLGQWSVDVQRTLDALVELDGSLPGEVAVVGVGAAGLVAISAAAVDARITKVATIGTLTSYISDEGYRDQYLGVMAPGILRHVGDVQHLASLLAPRRLVIAGAVSGRGSVLTKNALEESFSYTRNAYEARGDGTAVILSERADALEIVNFLR